METLEASSEVKTIRNMHEYMNELSIHVYCIRRTKAAPKSVWASEFSSKIDTESHGDIDDRTQIGQKCMHTSTYTCAHARTLCHADMHEALGNTFDSKLRL
jgi:hypothetical protein